MPEGRVAPHDRPKSPSRPRFRLYGGPELDQAADSFGACRKGLFLFGNPFVEAGEHPSHEPEDELTGVRLVGAVPHGRLVAHQLHVGEVVLVGRFFYPGNDSQGCIVPPHLYLFLPENL